jgi:hypothetical protein
MNARPDRKPSIRTLAPRVLNALLWLVFCAMAGTGLLLAFRLPPGSRGGRGLTALGMSRHEWGDIHTWLSYGFLALVLIHMALHWRWFWQIAARRRSWPLLAGVGAGLAIMAALTLQPVAKRGRGGADHGPEATHREADPGGGHGEGLRRLRLRGGAAHEEP